MKLKVVISMFMLIASITSSNASADIMSGLWQTERGENGGYLHIKFSDCGGKLCGVIDTAYNEKGEVGEKYAHLGKNIVTDMKNAGDNNWAKGKIWDPQKDKTYKAKMKLEGDVLKVSGCVAFICRSQEWTKVN